MTTINDIHNKLGHPNFKDTKNTIKKYNMEIENDNHTTCEDCLTAKAQKRNYGKENLNPESKPGIRIETES